MKKRINKADIEIKLIKLLGNYDLDSRDLRSDSSFTDDLGFDSIDFAELILTVEEYFDINISYVNYNNDTIDDLVNTIEKILNKILVLNQKKVIHSYPQTDFCWYCPINRS